MTQARDSAAKSTIGAVQVDRFMQSLRQTLEHIDDEQWLAKQSPLTSLFFTGTLLAGSIRRRQILLTNLPQVDERLRAIWHDWEKRSKSPLQSLIWEAVCQMPQDLENQSQVLLLLTYFEEPRPKQGEVIRFLALGRSTYYRYLDRAVAILGELITQLLRPALQLERPKQRPLVGRTALLNHARQRLQQGQVIHLIGGGGFGKSSLAAQLAADWGAARVFWYTIRPGLTDQLEQLLFSLAYFLHQQGVSGLWLHLSTNPEAVDLGKSITALRQQLAELRADGQPPPLLCFDEVDLLLPDELRDPPHHRRLRDFLEDLAGTDRAGAPLILIGQKLLLEPARDCLIPVTALTSTDVAALLTQAGIALAGEQQEQLWRFTRGNPLLLQLFLILQQRGEVLAATLQQLSAPVTIEWFLVRLRHHLTPAELSVLQELAVFGGGAPRDSWRTNRKALQTLAELGLASSVGLDRVELHPALRALLYEQLAAERKRELHLAAAAIFAERARFTEAAYHYMQGEQPALAAWLWYNHHEQEIQQGQAGAAGTIFQTLTIEQLTTDDDRRIGALLKAKLSVWSGDSEAGLQALAAANWADRDPLTAQAHEFRGELLAAAGDIDRSLAEYRQSLEHIVSLRQTQEVRVRLNVGRRALVYLRDQAQARQEVILARFDLEILQGELEDSAGNHRAARHHYSNALALADTVTSHQPNEHRLAKLHEALGILEARYANLESAVAHIEAAGRHYLATGNEICAVGVTNTNLSYAYLVKRRYAEAVPPAQRALDYFSKRNHPYWLALNEANLAEAYFYLADLAQAEHYAQRGLYREEVVVRPYCLYVLGHVRRVQQREQEAKNFCREAITAAEAINDPWALAPAWLALSACLHDAGSLAGAGQALHEALAIYQKLDVEQEISYVQQLLTTFQ